MISVTSLLLMVHLVGLALGVGAATVKLVLLLRSRADPTLLGAYDQIVRPVTRVIVLGLALLTLSGVGWLLLGYPLTPRLLAKLALVGTIWVLGPIIDNVAEPAFRRMAISPDGPGTPAFARVRGRYLTLELIATLLFYAVIVVWLY